MGNIFLVAGLHDIINSFYNYLCLNVLSVVRGIRKQETYFFVSTQSKWDEECFSNELISFAFSLGTSC